MEAVRVEIRVRPGARGASVGGTHDGGLVVRVPDVAEKGRATDAALRAVAAALGVRAGDVRLVSGGRSRRKIVEIRVDAGSRAGAGVRVDAGPAADQPAGRSLLHRVEELRRAGTDGRHRTSDGRQ